MTLLPLFFILLRMMEQIFQASNGKTMIPHRDRPHNRSHRKHMNWHAFFVEILKQELQRQKTRNARVSLRQWSTKLGIASGPLSEILTGRRKVTEDRALEIVEASRIPLTQKKRLLALMGRPPEVIRVAPKREHIEMIADWVNHAICGFYELDAVKVNDDFISKRLGISVEESKRRTTDLLKSGLLQVDENGQIFRTQENWDMSLTLSQKEMQEYRKSAVMLSREILNRVPSERGMFINLTYPGNTEHIEFVRREIKKLMDTIHAMSESEPRDELMRLSVQLFPYNFE